MSFSRAWGLLHDENEHLGLEEIENLPHLPTLLPQKRQGVNGWSTPCRLFAFRPPRPDWRVVAADLPRRAGRRCSPCFASPAEA